MKAFFAVAVYLTAGIGLAAVAVRIDEESFRQEFDDDFASYALLGLLILVWPLPAGLVAAALVVAGIGRLAAGLGERLGGRVS